MASVASRNSLPELFADVPNEIHPTAIVHSKCILGDGVQVGPYAVIEEHVVLGDGCEVGPGVHLTGHTTIGQRNRFHAGAVVGDAPQDFKYAGEPTRLIIGSGNVFREHATIHRAARLEEATEIGNGNLFMVGSHVGHNCRIGDSNIFANGALLAGHVTVADRVFISGNCLVHQFCRVGRLAMMQGGSGISKDLPPFCIARGDNGICGLNVVGLRRAGIEAGERLSLKRAYHQLFCRPGLARDRVGRAQTEFPTGCAAELVAFIVQSRRGVCRDTRASAGKMDHLDAGRD